MNMIVTDSFIKYSLQLANDILGYNECFGGDKETKRKLKQHIKNCEKRLSEIIEKENK